MSDYDHLIKYFDQTKDIAYTVLWDICGPGGAAARACVALPSAAACGSGLLNEQHRGWVAGCKVPSRGRGLLRAREGGGMGSIR